MGKKKDCMENKGINVVYKKENEGQKKLGNTAEYFEEVIVSRLQPKILGENDINRIERRAHYYTTERIHGLIPCVEKFASGNKIFKSCYKGDDAMAIKSLLPLMFTSHKESYMGKKGKSWENQSSRIWDDDLRILEIKENIHIIDAPDNLDDRRLVDEIRNALEHSHYIPGGDGIYIYNPKDVNPKIHPHNFIAFVPDEILYYFVRLVSLRSRKHQDAIAKADDDRIYEYPNGFNFEEIKDKIHFYEKVKEYSTGEGNEKEIVLTPQMEELIRKYFINHKIDFKNLQYIAESLVHCRDQVMFVVLLLLFHDRGYNKYKGLNCDELVSDTCENLGFFSRNYFSYSFYNLAEVVSDNVEIQKLLRDFGQIFIKKKQENGQPLIKSVALCGKYAFSYFIKHHWEYDSTKQSFKKGDIEIKFTKILGFIEFANMCYFEIQQTIKDLPRWLKLQLVKSAYINGLINLDDDLSGLQGVSNESKFTDREHVRNALAHSHNSYIMLHGVDDILLRDGYNKKTDSWGWECTVNLEKLYAETYSQMVHNMKSEESNFKSESDKLD